MTRSKSRETAKIWSGHCNILLESGAEFALAQLLAWHHSPLDGHGAVPNEGVEQIAALRAFVRAAILRSRGC
jgi:hypothetical protein